MSKTSTHTNTKRLRMLVADDAPFIREIVRAVAEKNELEIVGEAVDGIEAVELAAKLNPDVILMDLIMPRKSGVEAAQEILEKNPQIKIVAFSTLDQETMVMRALEAGCSSFVVKPFKGEELMAAINRSVNKKVQG